MDNQRFFNRFRDVSEVLVDVLLVCQGMGVAESEMMEKPFGVLASGVFAVMGYALAHAYDRISELEGDFKGAFDVKWPIEMNEEEKMDCRADSYHWTP